MRITLYSLLMCCLIFTSDWAQDQQNEVRRQLAQPILMALPSSLDGQDPLTLYTTSAEIQSAAVAINQVLVERKLEVRDIKQQINNMERLRAKMSAFQGDANALIAASSGADIYLEYIITLVKEGPAKKVRVDITVKEAATAKVLGSGSGSSDAMVTNDIAGLSQIAVNNSIDRIMEQIRGYWSEIPTNGKPILLTISSKTIELNKSLPSGKRLDREMTNLLKSVTISYRREQTTSQTLQFNPVYIDPFKYDDIEEFSYLIQDMLETLSLKYRAEIEGKSIEIQLD